MTGGMLVRACDAADADESALTRAGLGPFTVGWLRFRALRAGTALVAVHPPRARRTSRRVDFGALPLIALALTDRSDAVLERDLQLRGPCRVIEVGQRHPRQTLADHTLDGPQVRFLV